MIEFQTFENIVYIKPEEVAAIASLPPFPGVDLQVNRCRLHLHNGLSVLLPMEAHAVCKIVTDELRTSRSERLHEGATASAEKPQGASA